jgi:hypothetical protein
MKALAIGAATFAVYAALTSGFDVSEGREHAQWAASILQHGRISLDAPLSPNWLRGTDGRYYSAHEAGNAVAMVPVVALASVVRSGLALGMDRTRAGLVAQALFPLLAAFYVAATVAGFYVLACSALGLTPRGATWASWALALTTILAPYSRMLFDGVLGGALVVWALVAADRAARTGRAEAAVAAGALCGAAIATRQTLVVLTLPVAAHLWWRAGRSRRAALAAALALGAAPPLAWQAWFNAVRTGAPYLPAASLPQFANLTSDTSVLVGLLGQIASPGKSLFLYSPVLLLAFVGFREVARRAPGLAWSGATAVGLYLLFHASLRNWPGEWGWGPRYLVPLTPWLMLAAAPLVDRGIAGGVPTPRRAVLALFACGLAVQLVALSTNWHYRYAWLAQQGAWDRSTLAWSVRHGQLGETTVMFGENLLRTAGAAVSIRHVEGTSATTQRVANSLNWWPVAARAAGLSTWIVVPASLAVLLTAWWLTRWSVRVTVE